MVRGQQPSEVIVDDAPPYKLEEPPDNLGGAFLSGSLVNAQFSGVTYINIEREWDEWKVRLEKIARDRGVRMGIKAWLDPNGTGPDSDLWERTDRDRVMTVWPKPDASRAAIIVQLQVDDPELPDEHRVKTYQATAHWPQQAIWRALHAAGLVLEPELPRRPVRDNPQG